ncbi:12560_t:CDS:2, partial [Racocetra fulgida]
MQRAQRNWDKRYNPLKILERREYDYRKLINHRLQHGFSYASEGKIVAQYLLEAIRNKAVNGGNEKRIHEILKISWMNSTEHARLKYFKQLAEQVQKHEYYNALIHFDFPDVKITEWFKNEVDNCHPEISKKEYHRVFEQEFSDIISKVNNYKSIESFQNFVESYLDHVEGCKYKMYKESEETNESDVDAFRDSMLATLKDQREKYESDLVKFKAPSEYEIIMEKLGYDTKKHHSCHQPSGLRGTNHQYTNVLDPTPCHLRADNTDV